MSQSTRIAAWIAFVIAAIMIVGSAALWDQSATDLVSNVLLNTAAEFIGFGIALLVGAIIAKRVAARRLDEHAPTVVELVTQLRIGGTINGHAARCCVRLAVPILSDEALAPVRSERLDGGIETTCGVCGLKAPVVRAAAGHAKCGICGLRGAVWQLRRDGVGNTSDNPNEAG